MTSTSPGTRKLLFGVSRLQKWSTVVVASVYAAGFLYGGANLLALGGSPYYLLGGVALGLSALLAARGDKRCVFGLGAFLVGTILWATWEVGADGWQLLPRLLLSAMVCAALLLLTGISSVNVLRLAGACVLAGAIGWVAHNQWNALPADPLWARGVGSPAAPSVSRPAEKKSARDWPHYGGDRGGTRFSALDQLTPGNVPELEVAWTYRAGPDAQGRSPKLEVTPIKIGDKLYICTGYNDVIALDAETGREIWRHRSRTDIDKAPVPACRGVSSYEVPGGEGECAQRVYTATVDARLIALDATTGALCAGFGDRGTVSLLTGLGEVWKGYYYVTSAPAVVRGRLVLGGWISDGQYFGEPSGVIRAFDAVTGELSWAFDMGRPDDRDAPVDGEAYTRATPNSWAPMSADEELGLVYLPIGNTVPDFYGGLRRSFDEDFSSSVLALDAETGRPRWRFQTVRHDLWDYDVASQPTLIDLTIDGRLRRALIQPTKRGEVFLLDRETGEAIAEVDDRPAPQDGAPPGEWLATTQPYSTGMPSFSGPRLEERSMWGVTPFDQMWCRIKFRQARYEGPMTPPGLTPSIIYPGIVGGFNWGGVAVDSNRQLMVANSMRMPFYAQLFTREEADRRGVVLTQEPMGRHNLGWQVQANTPYAIRILPFLSPIGVPCGAPPFGVISAVDLDSRKVVWSRPLGDARDDGPLFLPSMLPLPIGTPNIGGPVITAGGLAFVAATTERAIRAIDLRDGRKVWSARLPTGGHATPMTYLSEESGRQFIVIAAGGNMVLNTPPGDWIIAYALPKREPD